MRRLALSSSLVLMVAAQVVPAQEPLRKQAAEQENGKSKSSEKAGASSVMVRAADAVPTVGPWGEWRRHFRGDTNGTKDLIILAVHLKPGQAPHPPHQHAEEEIMILAEGSGMWHVDGKEIAAQKGDVLYVAPWSMHGLRNTSDAPLTYYMMKWTAKGPATSKATESKR